VLLALALGACSTTRPSRGSGEPVPSVEPPLAGTQSSAAAVTGAGGSAEPSTVPGRDPRWATPLSRPGLNNFFKVTDGLYRGAQPEAQGFVELKKLGVRTIVNLRSAHSDQGLIREAGLADDAFVYEEIPMQAWHPEQEDVVRFLRIVSDPSRAPIFVHCQHGADRTGLMMAVYRMAVQGWTRQDAIRELREGGYGFHEIWRGIVEFLEKMDIERARTEAAAGRPPR
jgi:protein tyrosine phosphatase (PTP) superfamily phosphohydrolase (DUF442 family)